MRSAYLFLLVACMHVAFIAGAQNCCADPVCMSKAQSLAKIITPLLQFIGNGSVDPAVNKKALEKAFQKDPVRYNSFTSIIYQVIKFTDEDDHDQCFRRFLLPPQYVELSRWMAYFNDLKNPVSFPSPEFCQGFRTRLEVGQGAANFLARDVAYLGSVKGLVSYTFGKKESCGNKVRLLAGPALFLRDKSAYAAMTVRAGYRVKDIMIKNPPVFLGNLNLFGEYSSNFEHFNYAGIGAEAQLGRFGVNATVNRSFESRHLGFLFGIFIGNKKKK